MNMSTRPDEITSILQLVNTAHVESLTAYIDELEARQYRRPGVIAATLKTVYIDLTPEIAANLESYIAGLEANLEERFLGDGDPSRDATWLYWRSVRREHEQKARQQKKHNHYE